MILLRKIFKRKPPKCPRCNKSRLVRGEYDPLFKKSYKCPNCKTIFV